jgi:hypothetical protein
VRVYLSLREGGRQKAKDRQGREHEMGGRKEKGNKIRGSLSHPL